MKRIKHLACKLMAVLMLVTCLPAGAVFAADDPSMPVAKMVYTDVPTDSWAKDAIYEVFNAQLMSGQDQAAMIFGYGKQITKAEFVTILCNMMKWDKVQAQTPSFSDVPADSWYYANIETALANGVMDAGTAFSPDKAITREELATMFVRALGLSDAAKVAEKTVLPFTDVTTNKGYIAVARDIGMINGLTDTTFGPASTAKREEAAAMLYRVYKNYSGNTEFLHGFYAISAYSQKDLMRDMDAVTLGWSAMNYSGGAATLNTTDGQYKIPQGYELVTSYLDENKVKAHLGVYMDRTQGVNELLSSSSARTAAVDAIMAELTKSYDAIGKNPYSGVTIDFEGLAGSEMKQGFNAFLTELDGKLSAAGKTLYVAVQPALPDGSYYDGFDYKTIGALADKVILMAHDYNPTTLAGYEGTEWHKNAALTPIGQVYYSLKAITDSNTGVADKSKIVLAISFAAVGWQVDESGKLMSPASAAADSAAVNGWLAKATGKGFSQTYRNPYITYTTDEGKNMFLWYENEQSVAEKAALARMMGVDGISLWRIGNIPNYSGFNVMNSVK